MTALEQWLDIWYGTGFVVGLAVSVVVILIVAYKIRMDAFAAMTWMCIAIVMAAGWPITYPALLCMCVMFAFISASFKLFSYIERKTGQRRA